MFNCLRILCISVVWFVTFFFYDFESSLSLALSFFFFLVSLAENLTLKKLYLFKYLALSFIDLFYFLLSWYFIYFCSDFKNLLLANKLWALIVLFFSSLRCIVKLFIWDIFVWGEHLLLWAFLLELLLLHFINFIS